MALLIVSAGLYLWAVRRDLAHWQLGIVAALATMPGVLQAENF